MYPLTTLLTFISILYDNPNGNKASSFTLWHAIRNNDIVVRGNDEKNMVNISTHLTPIQTTSSIFL